MKNTRKKNTLKTPNSRRDRSFTSIKAARLMPLVLALLSQPSLAETLTIATASNFQISLKKIVRLYETQNPNMNIRLIQGSSGKLYSQIMHGLPADIFLSADTQKPQALIKDNQAYDKPAPIYAFGQLTFWSQQTIASAPNVSSNPSSPSSIANQLKSCKSIALANPKLAPYGLATKQTLDAINFQKQAHQKLITGENINQTLQLMFNGNIDCGFLAQSQNSEVLKLSDKYHKSYSSLNISYEYHDNIAQQAVIIKNTKHLDLALHFLDFLSSEEIRILLINEGYTLASKLNNESI